MWNSLKAILIELVCKLPKKPSVFITEAVVSVAKAEYPQHWQDLVPTLLKQLESFKSLEHPDCNVRLLKILHKIVKDLPDQPVSEDSRQKTSFTLTAIHHFLLTETAGLLQAFQESGNVNEELLKCWLDLCRRYLKIWYCASYHALYKQAMNLTNWITVVKGALDIGLPAEPRFEEHQILLFKVKGEALKCLIFFAESSKSQLPMEQIQEFTMQTWNVIEKAPADTPDHVSLGIVIRAYRFSSML
jgi:hypothetical protein